MVRSAAARPPGAGQTRRVPTRRDNVVAAWIQDQGPDSSRTDLTASSRDGGRTWQRSTIPGLTRCEGGTADSGADPWVSSGVDGTIYFAGLAPFFDVGLVRDPQRPAA